MRTKNLATPTAFNPSLSDGGVWGGGCAPPQKMFLILEHGMAFSGAFWAGGDRYSDSRCSDNRYSDSK